jgi:hypothetical protein
MTPRHIGLAVIMLLSATTGALAQGMVLPSPGYQGTRNEQDACKPAVFKFCQAAVPDTFRILECLQKHRPRIGKACQQVLSSNGV